MTDTGVAKLFMHGRSQAVRLPKAFRLPGREVRVRRTAVGIELEPIPSDEAKVRKIFAALAECRGTPFMEEGRQQPPLPPPDDISFDR